MMTDDEKALFKAHADTTALLQTELTSEKALNMKLQAQLQEANTKIKELEGKLNATAK